MNSPLDRSFDKLDRVFLYDHNPSVKAPRVFDFGMLKDLPQNVARYFRYSLKEGQRLIHSAQFTQIGTFCMHQDGRWNRFQAQQSVSIDPPSFVWEARIHMGPLINIRVRDSYRDGKASTKARICGMLPILNPSSSPEIVSASLQRYLAEAPWFPTALLPSDCLNWNEIDAKNSVATLRVGEIEVSLQFEFNELGQITKVFTPGRFRLIQRRFELTPWAGYFGDYAEQHGMRIPMQGNVEWQLPEGPFAYFKGKIVNIDYEFDTGHQEYLPHKSSLVLL